MRLDGDMATHATYRLTELPDVIEPRPASVLSPFGARVDPYYWLRDDTRSSPEVLAVLERENAYADRYFAPLGPLVETLTTELKSRLPGNEHSVPYWDQGRWWQRCFEEGLEYPRIVSGTDVEERAGLVLFDPNVAREESAFYALGCIELSADERVLAIVEDRTGRREYTLRFECRQAGTGYGEQISGVEPELVWLCDNSILYIRKDPVTLLGLSVYRHYLGTDPAQDVCVYEEQDDEFTLSITRSRSGRYVCLVLHQTLTSEERWARWDDPTLRFEVVLERRHGVEYQAEDYGQDLILLSNERAPEFELYRLGFAERGQRSRWQTLLAAREDALLDEFCVFNQALVVRERAYGSTRLMRLDWQTRQVTTLSTLSATDVVEFSDNADASLSYVRWSSSSLTQPRCIWDTDLLSGVTTQRYVALVPNSDLTQLMTQSVVIYSRDQQPIPVTLLRQKKPSRSPQPVLVVGYGAYGLSYDPNFRSNWLSLVERGVAIAIAHIRGGQELGRHWTEAGRRERKTNSFNDFEDVLRGLGQAVEIDATRMVAMGGSAGGLLMGAVANQTGALCRAMVVQVPFVDVLTTMLDESLPLTTNEYDEWGNPSRSLAEYQRLLSYSPVDQVRPQAYPAMLITTGLHDSQVQYWEPVKWLAQLRVKRSNDLPLLLRTDLEAGHGGKAGRFERLREVAYEYAFILNELGLV